MEEDGTFTGIYKFLESGKKLKNCFWGRGIRFKTSTGRVIEFFGYRMKEGHDVLNNPDREWKCTPGFSIIGFKFSGRKNIIGIIQNKLPGLVIFFFCFYWFCL